MHFFQKMDFFDFFFEKNHFWPKIFFLQKMIIFQEKWVSWVKKWFLGVFDPLKPTFFNFSKFWKNILEPNFRGVVMVGDVIQRKLHALPLYLTARYQIQTACLRKKNILSPSGLPSDHAFAFGLAFIPCFCPRAKALGQKHGMKASPQAKAWSEGKPSGERMFFFLGTWSRYDIYQSNIKARHVIFSI